MADNPSDSNEDKSFVLEERCRLSNSMLWKIQRKFFEARGIDAWRRGIVPHYITSNSYIAEAYARVVFAYLRDWQEEPASPASRAQDSSRRINIIELGAGNGRFAYAFLKKLLARCSSEHCDLRFRYIMTDFAERTIDYWRAHSMLKPLVEKGKLDFARFDIEKDQQVELLESGEVLSPGKEVGPVVLLANYFFDGIPIDAWRVEGSLLAEALVTLSTDREESDPLDPEILDRVKLSYSLASVPEKAYDDEDFNYVLEKYRERGETLSIRFPTVALRFIRWLRNLSGERFLMLTGDKGFIREDDLSRQFLPGLAVHGSFSMSVDYHAMARYVERAGGEVLQPDHRHCSLLVVGFLQGRPKMGNERTRRAFADNIEHFGPDDFFVLKKTFDARTDELGLEQLVAWMRFSAGDPGILSRLITTLRDYSKSSNIDGDSRAEIVQLIEMTWELYLPLGETEDIAFELGKLLFSMDFDQEALTFFRRSVEYFGPDPQAIYNQAVCLYAMGELSDAIGILDQVLELKPAHEGAFALRKEIQERVRH